MPLLSPAEVSDRPRRLIPSLLLFGFIFATCLFSLYLDKAADARDATRYESSVEQITQTLHFRLDLYNKLLVSTRAYLTHEPEARTNEKFLDFVEQLNIEEEYPGTQGLGYQAYVPGEKLAEHTALVRQTIAPEYQPINAKPNDNNALILFFYPETAPSAGSRGLNTFLEPARRQAMEQARDTGKLTISSRLIVGQLNGINQQPGFFAYMPIYEAGEVPATVEERRAKLKGFVYSPFRTKSLFAELAHEDMKSIAFTVYDGTEITPDTLLFTSQSSTSAAESPRFTSQKTLDVSGRTWTILFSTTPQFESAVEKSITPFLFGFGLLVSFLLYLFSKAQLDARLLAEISNERIKHSQKELQQKNQQITDIFESITDGFAAIDQNWIFSFVNKEGARMLNSTQSKVVGRSIWEIFPELETSAFGKAFHKSMSESVPQAIEDYYPPLQGWFSVRCYPSSNGLSIYFQDVTSRKSLEKQKDEFMAIASHELKTPVTSLKAFAQVLHRRFLKVGDMSSAELLGKMNSQVDRLTSLIMDLLDVSKIEAGKLILHTEEFSIKSLIQEVMEELQRTTDTHRLTLTGDNVKLLADRERIGQVITNLLSNAIKYSPSADRVEIFTKRTGEFIHIDVTDFGIGIANDKLIHIFERFYRAGGANQETFPGLGLGLYITAEIVRRHEGTITVTSEEGRKTTFTVRLPLKAKSLKKLPEPDSV